MFLAAKATETKLWAQPMGGSSCSSSPVSRRRRASRVPSAWALVRMWVLSTRHVLEDAHVTTVMFVSESARWIATCSEPPLLNTIWARHLSRIDRGLCWA